MNNGVDSDVCLRLLGLLALEYHYLSDTYVPELDILSIIDSLLTRIDKLCITIISLLLSYPIDGDWTGLDGLDGLDLWEFPIPRYPLIELHSMLCHLIL